VKIHEPLEDDIVWGRIVVRVFAPDCACPGIDCPHAVAFDQLNSAVETFVEQLDGFEGADLLQVEVTDLED
jgi:hypothetical protein